MTEQKDRIAAMFEAKKRAGRKALITFVTAGDPTPGATLRLVPAMEQAGADLIELGIPFSDPVAEGPVIQAADLRALKNGLRIDGVFDMVRTLRETTQVPLVFLMYINCVFNYGPDAFFRKCAETGVDGVIIPDLPFEEKDEAAPFAARHGVKLISLVAPTSEDRTARIASAAEGFLYCVSSLGVTGERSSFTTDFDAFFAPINRSAKVPTALGFGISTPEQVKSLKKYADGVIVGSAVVRLVGAAKNEDEAVRDVSGFVKTLRGALDE